MSLDNLRQKTAAELANVDLSQPANWRNPSPGRGAAFSRLERRFTSVKNAVRFVMEDLTEFPQSTAWIAIHEDKLTFPDIVVLYGRLRDYPVANEVLPSSVPGGHPNAKAPSYALQGPSWVAIRLLREI